MSPESPVLMADSLPLSQKPIYIYACVCVCVYYISISPLNTDWVVSMSWLLQNVLI